MPSVPCTNPRLTRGSTVTRTKGGERREEAEEDGEEDGDGSEVDAAAAALAEVVEVSAATAAPPPLSRSPKETGIPSHVIITRPLRTRGKSGAMASRTARGSSAAGTHPLRCTFTEEAVEVEVRVTEWLRTAEMARGRGNW